MDRGKVGFAEGEREGVFVDVEEVLVGGDEVWGFSASLSEGRG
jgi:hypothetical protein